MEDIVYHTNYELEDTYWWFTARNIILSEMIKKYCNIPLGSNILDIGCGTGGFAKFLSENYNMHCLDTSAIALDYCRQRGLKNLYNELLSKFSKRQIPIAAALMMDVIEHIENDKGVLLEAYQTINENGYLIATVPAYQWLWSLHDEVHMHYRRYSKQQISKVIQDAGFKIIYKSYFNFFLFFPAVLKRFFDKKKVRDENYYPVDKVSPILNKLFNNIFSFERKILPIFRFPFGLSVLVIAQKK